ncbi:phage repressor protein/antirepressor Ant [Mannheimia haemolytica USDA-ARS-USMARC-185]|uniref:P22AR C-terminal domain-containing protein n=1 Tax=Mannheimia haemolytica TaxID=75985 RepID=UPI00059D2936|nr:P22AR C-terminal domain-containing protein [Mannheimia haemolytica]AGI35675.2 phage repressor protein/antirepressor Ant [Mannheimia haemolytica USDA-ARS-USMARC-185]
MSNQIFNFNSNLVRVELFENQPHFCLLDVCEIFEIQNSRRVQSEMLDPQGVRQAYILAKDEKKRKTSFINEPNLYRIIFRSEKPVAKEFQNWVFEEVLPQIRKTGKYALQNNQQNLPLALPEKKYTFDFTEDELQSLVWAWFAFVRGIHTFRYIYPMFQKLGSNMAGEIYGQGFEYSHTAQSAHKILERITREFDFDPMTNWRVLKHVRGFDPAFKKPTF